MKMRESNLEKYYTYTTSKGLKVSFIQRENSSTLYMAMLVNFGSTDINFITLNNNEFVKTPKGVAHFLEHKMFESKNYNTFEEFSKRSAEINAYTTATSTVYYFSCTDKKEENIKLFLDLLTNPYITPDNVEKEKGIIKQEINMYKDDPSSRVYSNLLQGMYHKNYVKYDIAGETEDINAITYEDIVKCYDTFYNCRNSEIFVIGNIGKDKLFSLIESNKGFIEGEKSLKIYPNEPLISRKKEVKESMKVNDISFLIGFKLEKAETKGRKLLKKDIICSIILECICGKMSTLYEKLYKKSYVDSNFSYGVQINNKYSFNTIGGISNYPKRVLEEVYGEVYKLIGTGIDTKDFNDIKKMLIGNYTRIFDDSFSLLANMISSRNKGGCFLEIIDIINSIGENEIYNHIKESFGVDRTTLSVINPIR